MAKQYGFSNEQWGRIKDLLPGKKGDPGLNGEDKSPVRECCSVGAALRRALERPAGSVWQVEDVHQRFTRWAENLGAGFREPDRRPG